MAYSGTTLSLHRGSTKRMTSSGASTEGRCSPLNKLLEWWGAKAGARFEERRIKSFGILSLPQRVVGGKKLIQLLMFNICIDSYAHMVTWMDQ